MLIYSSLSLSDIHWGRGSIGEPVQNTEYIREALHQRISNEKHVRMPSTCVSKNFFIGK